MLIVTLRRHLFAAGLVLALTPALLTAAPAVADKGKAASPAEKVRTDLDQVISVEISEQPLDLALKQLHEQTKINFVIDRWGMQQMGMQIEAMAPVNLKLKDVKTKSALRSILTPYQLSYAIIGDTVVVSTDDLAMLKQMRQRVSLDFEKVELTAALKKLARETATNLIVDTRAAKEAKTEVTLSMEDVPLETAVRLMAEMAGLKPVRVGNVLFVTTEANATKMRADPDLAQPMGPRGVPQEMILQPGGGIQIQPGGGPVPPPAPAPGIGAVPVNPAADSTDKPPDKSEKTEKADKKVDPADKPDKSDKPEKSDKTEKSDKADKPAPAAPEKK